MKSQRDELRGGKCRLIEQGALTADLGGISLELERSVVVAENTPVVIISELILVHHNMISYNMRTRAQ